MSERAVVGSQPWPVLAVVLSAIAGVWSVLAPVLGHMGPPWPCVIAGVVLLIAATMLRLKPFQNVGWGLVIVIVGVGIILLGRGGMVPGLTGFAGGLAAVVWRDRG